MWKIHQVYNKIQKVYNKIRKVYIKICKVYNKICKPYYKICKVYNKINSEHRPEKHGQENGTGNIVDFVGIKGRIESIPATDYLISFKRFTRVLEI